MDPQDVLTAFEEKEVNYCGMSKNVPNLRLQLHELAELPPILRPVEDYLKDICGLLIDFLLSKVRDPVCKCHHPRHIFWMVNKIELKNLTDSCLPRT
jgi:hypothetical protein